MTTPPDASEEPGIESCFVISPIGDRLAAFGSDERKRYEEAMQIWDYVILPACQEVLGIEPVRADGISQPGEITEQVFLHLRDDDLVIADLTGANPNVMYELGLRHTTNKLTIQIGEKDRLPFDITMIRTIQFIRTETGLVEARNALVKAIRDGNKHGALPVSATRVWLALGSHPPVIPEIELPEEQEEEEPGFLDRLAESEEAMPLLATVSHDVTVVLEELAVLATEAQEEMNLSDARGGGAGGRLRIAQELANDLEEPTTRIEQSAADFVGHLARIDPGISYLISQVEEDPDVRGSDEFKKFEEGIQALADAAEPALQSIGDSADMVKSLEKVSNRLRPVVRRLSTALRRISESSSTILEWNRRLNALDEGADS